MSSATTCRASAGVCDLAENCTGSSAACPADAFVAAATVCRASAGVCDVAENCTGVERRLSGRRVRELGDGLPRARRASATSPRTARARATPCPADGFASSATVCRALGRRLRRRRELHGRRATACPADGFASSRDGRAARSAGVCDVAENCTGSSGGVSGRRLRERARRSAARSAGVCDVAENCTGSSAACPGRRLRERARRVCRGSAGVCDVAENCTGSGAACPADGFASAATVCRASARRLRRRRELHGVERGVSGRRLPSRARPSAAPRRASATSPRTAPGRARACPADGFAVGGDGLPRARRASATSPRTAPGRARRVRPTASRARRRSAARSAGVCDVAENCTGSSAACPADGFAVGGDGLPRVGAASATSPRTARARARACPADAFEPSATVCRAAAGVCDVAENCTGSSDGVPGGRLRVERRPICRALGGRLRRRRELHGLERAVSGRRQVASGPSAAPRPASATSPRAATASNDACPADAFQSAATVCRASGGVCDVAENCTGSGAPCPADAKMRAARLPRRGGRLRRGRDLRRRRPTPVRPTPSWRARRSAAPSAGICDVAENCTGSAAACPADAFESSATVCRAAAGVCDVVENCTGASGGLSGRRRSSTTECRAVAGRLRRGRELRRHRPTTVRPTPSRRARPSAGPTAGVCDVAENCTGSGAACPADAVEPATTECRAVAGICDVAENCDGSAVDCPDGCLRVRRAVTCRAGRPASATSARAAPAPGATVRPIPSSPAPSSAGRRAASATSTENCTGGGAACPADAVEPATTVCRPAASTADAPETCDGVDVLLSRPMPSCRPGTPCDDGRLLHLQTTRPTASATASARAGRLRRRQSLHRRRVRLAGRRLPLRVHEQRHLHRAELRQLRGRRRRDLRSAEPRARSERSDRSAGSTARPAATASSRPTTSRPATTATLVSGCRPDKPQQPLDSCLNNCNEPICADPARIKFGTHDLPDLFSFHGRLISDVPVDFINNHFVIELRDIERRRDLPRRRW